MNLESQVCSLELAKRLKELGIKQESLVYWMNIQHCVHTKTKKNEYGIDEVECDGSGNIIIDKIDYRIELGNPYAWNINKDNYWAAFTASELGEILPNSIDIHKDEPFNNFRIIIKKFISIDNPMRMYNNWVINYECDTTESGGENACVNRLLTKNIYDPSLANAMAKMLIYLLENKLMEIPK